MAEVNPCSAESECPAGSASHRLNGSGGLGQIKLQRLQATATGNELMSTELDCCPTDSRSNEPQQLLLVSYVCGLIPLPLLIITFTLVNGQNNAWLRTFVVAAICSLSAILLGSVSLHRACDSRKLAWGSVIVGILDMLLLTMAALAILVMKIVSGVSLR